MDSLNSSRSENTNRKKKKRKLSELENGDDDEPMVTKEKTKTEKSKRESSKIDDSDTVNGIYDDENISTKKKVKRNKNDSEVRLDDSNCSRLTENCEDSRISEIEEIPNRKKKKKKMNENSQINELNNSTTEVDGFTILGSLESETKKKVKRVLPEWLSKPVVISSDLRHGKVKIEEIRNLNQKIAEILRKNHIKMFFPVQSVLIPWLLECHTQRAFPPRDICISAPTGSGKTLAYVVPVLQILDDRSSFSSLKVLVVLPVKELAIQVHEVFQMVAKPLKLKVGLACGSQTLEQEASKLGFDLHAPENALDVLVSTPGRLIDHLKKYPQLLRNLQFLIIDEADRVFESEKSNWLQKVEESVAEKYSTEQDLLLPGMNQRIDRDQFLLPVSLTAANCNWFQHRPQKLLFSATLSQDPEKLQALNLFQPKLFTSVVGTASNVNADSTGDKFIGKYTTPAELEEFYIPCEKQMKPALLYYLMDKMKFKRVMCFTGSVEATEKLSTLMKQMLGDKFFISGFSSNLPPRQRQLIWKDFTKGRLNLLITTDLAARGLDIKNVELVVMYDVPEYVKTYVHRAGRTARAGCSGTAISLIEPLRMKHFRDLLKSAKKDNVSKMVVESSDLQRYESRLNAVLLKMSE